MDTKPGYLLKIETWENDLDNEKTVEIDGLTADQVNFYLDIAFLFHKNNNHKTGYGNGEVGGHPRRGLAATGPGRGNLYEKIDAIIKAAKENGVTIPKDWVVDDPEYEDRYSDPIQDLIGVWNEWENYRVFDSFKVMYIPEPIKDVSEKFYRKT